MGSGTPQVSRKGALRPLQVSVQEMHREMQLSLLCPPAPSCPDFLLPDPEDERRK